MSATLYLAQVMHRRCFPVRYRFTYRVFSMLLDIERIDETARGCALFSYNRFNVFSFYERDHGDGGPLRPWIESVLSRAGITLEGGRIELLCFPRLFGYAFNPLAIWYCRHADGTLRAVLCQVRNTFGERHGYLLHDSGEVLDWPVRQSCEKCFHVSPFIGMNAHYRFRLSEPGKDLRVVIHEYQDGELMLSAAQTGHGAALSSIGLLRALARTPLMTFKVMAMIHWQALKIWLGGARFHKKPAPPQEDVSP